MLASILKHRGSRRSAKTQGGQIRSLQSDNQSTRDVSVKDGRERMSHEHMQRRRRAPGTRYAVPVQYWYQFSSTRYSIRTIQIRSNWLANK